MKMIAYKPETVTNVLSDLNNRNTLNSNNNSENRMILNQQSIKKDNIDEDLQFENPKSIFVKLIYQHLKVISINNV
jgi:hypothetical protein